MIILINNIKTVLRKALPQTLFVIVYKLYKYSRGHEVSQKQIKQAGFTERGKYMFSLGEMNYPIILDPSNGGVDSEIFADGVYEPEILKIIRKHVNKNDIFLDIGANIGQHSLYISNFVKDVIAFEPITRIANQFQESININYKKNITLYNIGLGTKDETVAIYGFSGNMGASSIIAKENRRKIQDINITSLDAFINEKEIEKVNIIKIDVEGFELDVLLGAQKTIALHTPIIFLEYSPYFYKKIDPAIGEKIIFFLFEQGYSIYNIDDGTTKIKINNISELDNIDQTNIMCISE